MNIWLDKEHRVAGALIVLAVFAVLAALFSGCMTSGGQATFPDGAMVKSSTTGWASKVAEGQKTVTFRDGDREFTISGSASGIDTAGTIDKALGRLETVALRGFDSADKARELEATLPPKPPGGWQGFVSSLTPEDRAAILRMLSGGVPLPVPQP